MKQILMTIPPEAFDADLHTLPTAGELLLAGDRVTIDANGIAMPVTGNHSPDGWVIEVSRKGEVVEIAAIGEQQDDGGYYFEHICVMTITD